MTALPGPEARPGRLRRPTVTATFGSSRRESHDASAFYDRFVAPELTADDTVSRPEAVDVIYEHDARDMSAIASSSVALVVTSPPYFAGKEYEESLGENGVPGSYFEYLALLRDVFSECKRVLEPGGRVAVNVANLGRRPYRSLAGDVAEILQDLGLLLRGEVVWWKGRAAGGSCAWGTFQRPSNPVLRDVTERIVVASKGRFERALKPKRRAELGLPSTATISRDEFLEATTDLWEIPPESATRVGHPAPFPLALPTRLIELYTYEGDVVLDPFMGSGSTAVAAARTNRRYLGFETDPSYLARALRRVGDEAVEQERIAAAPPTALRVRVPAAPVEAPAGDDDPVAQAVRAGRQAKDVAQLLLERSGFVDIKTNAKPAGAGVELAFVAVDQTGLEWGFDLSGAFTSNRAGLRRMDALWRSLGKAGVLHHSAPGVPLVLLTTDVPTKGSAGAAALEVVRGPGLPVLDVVELLEPAGQERLRDYGMKGLAER